MARQGPESVARTLSPTKYWEPAIAIALASGLLYFIGSLYLGGFHEALGVPLGEVQSSVADTMKHSFFALLYPTTFLVLVGIACLLLRRRAKSTPQPEGVLWPLTWPEVFFVVAGVWATNLLFDLVSPVQSVVNFRPQWASRVFLNWRDFLLFSLAALGLFGRYRVQLRRRLKAQADLDQMPEHAYLVLAGAILLLLSASLCGTVVGRELASGCQGVTIVEFSPVPEGLDGNATHWLVLAQNGQFFVRTLPFDAAGTTTVVHSQPGLVVHLDKVPPATVC